MIYSAVKKLDKKYYKKPLQWLLEEVFIIDLYIFYFLHFYFTIFNTAPNSHAPGGKVDQSFGFALIKTEAASNTLLACPA